MIETIRYKKCTCDICGSVISIPLSQCAPDDWKTITLTKAGMTIFSMDVCNHCCDAVVGFIDNLKDSDMI